MTTETVARALIITSLLATLSESPLRGAPAPCAAPEFHQFGQLLTREGHRIVLNGGNLGEGGKPVSVRAAWIPGKDGVRETAEASSDGGKTWKTMFDIVFRAHRAAL